MTALSPYLVWIALFLLGSGGFIATLRPRASRVFLSFGWSGFGIYWALMAPHYLYAKDSIIEATLCILALPVGLYFGWKTSQRAVPALETLGRAVSVMGLIYLLVEQVDALRKTAIESVAVQTVWVVEALFGHALVIQEGPLGYQGGIAAPNAPGGLLLTHIELACTGLGSIAIVVGLIAVLDESPLKRTLGAVFATLTIYSLNVARTVFITSAYVGQWFQFYVPQVLSFTGYDDPRVTSFFIADKVISQSLSLIVLVILILGIRRLFPSFDAVITELLSLIPALRADNSE